MGPYSSPRVLVSSSEHLQRFLLCSTCLSHSHSPSPGLCLATYSPPRQGSSSRAVPCLCKCRWNMPTSRLASPVHRANTPTHLHTPQSPAHSPWSSCLPLAPNADTASKKVRLCSCQLSWPSVRLHPAQPAPVTVRLYVRPHSQPSPQGRVPCVFQS